ncbi:hypothetical protein, partial [Parafrigoribacterium mesophilum]
DASQHNIVVGPVTGLRDDGTPIQVSHRLTTGQAVVYRTTGKLVGGLANGGTYYVIVVNQYVIQLAATRYDTTAHSYACGTDTCTDEPKPI